MEFDISEMTVEERLMDIFAFMMEGLTMLAQEGTKAAAAGEMYVSRERFSGAAAILQIIKHFSKMLPELEECAEFVAREDENINEIIDQTAMLVCSDPVGTC